MRLSIAGRASICALVAAGGLGSCSRETAPVPPPVPAAVAMSDDMTAGPRPASTASAPADPAALSRFRADLERSGPSREVFARHLPALGARPILDVLEGANPSCHGEAHELGRALMALRRDIGAALRECGDGCTSACMHGAVGEAFGGSDISTIVGRMKSFCREGPMHELYPAGNCAHGIGHALMFAANRDVDDALDGCARFEEPGMRYYCATGVYMELLLQPRPPVYPPASHEPCSRHPEVSAACYRYRAQTLAVELGGLEALRTSCLAQPDLLRQGCFHGLGAAIMGSLPTDPGLLGRYCSAERAADRTLCVEGAMEKRADFDRGLARSICAKQSGEVRRACDEAVAHGMYSMTKPSMGFYVPTTPRASAGKGP